MSIKVMGLVWSSDVAGSGRWVLLKLADCADDKGGNAFPSVATLAKACRYSTRQVRRALGDLLKSGLIKVARDDGERDGRTGLPVRRGGHAPTIYVLDLVAIADREAREPTPKEESEGEDIMSSLFVFEEAGADVANVTAGVTSTTVTPDIAMSAERTEPSINRPPPARARSAEEEGASVEWSREVLIDTAKGFRLTLANATLLIDGALKHLTPRQVADVLGEAMGRDRDHLKRAMAEAVDHAKRQRSAEEARQLLPLIDRIKPLGKPVRERLLAELNERRKANGLDPAGSFYATQDRWLAQQAIELGVDPAEIGPPRGEGAPGMNKKPPGYSAAP